MSGLSRLNGVVLALGIAFGTAPALAATCDDIEFDDAVKAANGDLVLNGLGLRKATIFKVRVYVAGLYLAEKSSDAANILGADRPWRLELRFVRDVDASDMKDALHEGFEDTGADLAPLESRIDKLVAMFGDFSEGQKLSFMYDPGAGTAVALDGQSKGSIEGFDFASTLLAIWLGPNPPNKDIKAGLLGGACG